LVYRQLILILSSKILWSGSNINCVLACLKKKWKNGIKTDLVLNLL